MATAPGYLADYLNGTPDERRDTVYALKAPTSGACAAFMSKYLRGAAACSIFVISDSTYDQTNIGAAAERPMLKLANMLAPLNPAATVNFRHWNMTAGSNQSDGQPLGGYDNLGVGKSKVIQSGTGTDNAGGPWPLDIYNLAATGTTPDYVLNPTRWFAAINPFSTVAPDVVFINHGHNIGSGTGLAQRAALGKLIRAVKTRWPLAAILVTAQNPTDPSKVADSALDTVRAATVASIAAEEGCGLVNAFGRFLENPNWKTDYLNTDGLHESDLGAQVWFDDCIKPHFDIPSSLMAPSSPSPSRDYLYIPAGQFHALVGSPTLAVVNSETQMWALPPGVASCIQADVVLPEHWTQYDAWLYWAVAGTIGYTASTVAAFRFKRQQRAYHVNVPADVSPYPIAAAQDPGIVARGPNNGSAYQTIQSNLSLQSTVIKAPMGLQIYRDGGNAADTLTADTAYIKGLLLVRAT